MKDIIKAFNRATEAIKEKYNAVAVANYDQKALYSNFKAQGFDFHEFEATESEEGGVNVYINKEGLRIVACGFEFMSKFECELAHVTGYNKCRFAGTLSDGVFYARNLFEILPFNKEQSEQIKQDYDNLEDERQAWQHYNDNVRPFLKELGIRFEVKEPIYWHFLECLPPICCKGGGFYCSEPVRHKNGKPVYYKLTKKDNKFFIELNTL